MEVLAEILTSVENIPFSTKKRVFTANMASKKSETVQESLSSNRELVLPQENDFIDEYELDALQHRVLSQNIKRATKRVQSSKKFETLEKNIDKKNVKIFQDFQNFIRPSTSQISLSSK